MPINITPQGVVEYSELRDGERWRTTIEPGGTARAAELLSSEELAQVQAAWTPEIVAAWEAARAAEQAQGEAVGLGSEALMGSGEGVIPIANRSVAPSTNPVDAGVLYAEGGALYWRGSDGTVTQIAPK